MKQNFTEKILLPIGDKIFGLKVYSELLKHRSYSLFSSDELIVLQQKKLKKLINHAVTTCDYYKDLMNKQNPIILDFPVINKRTVNKNIDLLISKNFKKSKLVKFESSGSTGLRSEVYLSKDEISITRAITINWWEWNGYKIGDKLIQTGITPKRGIVKSLKDYFFNTQYISAFGLNEKQIFDELKKINSKNNSKTFLFGYASSLYEFAKVAEKYRLNIKLEKALSQGDKLFNHYRQKISQVFKCDVVEDYGLSEGFMVGQKVDLPYYYIYSPSIYVEILDDENNPVKDGEMGRIILTKLDGFAMPLIRFDSGDLGIKLPSNKYPIKRKYNFPLLQKVIGRNTDIITSPNGKILVVHTFTGIFEHYSEIEQFQIIQDSKKLITVKYIPSDSFHQDILKKIEFDFYKQTKSDFIFKWDSVSHIKSSNSGKPEIIINKLLLK